MPLGEIEDVLPLSPLQQGLLFHALYDEQGSNAYILQSIFDITGQFDPKSLHTAAQALLRRHANLRARFLHQGVDEPVQVIPREVALPWQEIDLHGLDAEAGQAEFARLAERDRVRRFDPADAPLLRFTLVRTTPSSYRLIFTVHHILLDGWSSPILFKELFALYRNGGDIDALPRVVPYRDYLAWLKRQDRGAAEQAWKNALDGLEEPTKLVPILPTSFAVPQIYSRRLTKELSHSLADRSRRYGLTLNTFIQGAWGVLLGYLTGRHDVVFGVTTAGRSPDLEGVERMVGLLSPP